ncbi:major royal jelly protein [Geobacter sp. OR-1]|uniref:L-dopachrome tautomerase-related protein n=1 Tax=Geobacter sp. OR-1 TaxID=1266765 RepID=UPI000542D2AA|nr:L-dopachrome tautomerase-related protein [Geobacter sp. OR-1]GAM08513.1 major royal jelly protein [Geobacter sp. OR-1]
MFCFRLIAILALLLSAGCALPDHGPLIIRHELMEIASTDRQWTGIAISREGRKFVSFPRWNESVVMSVGEILADGSIIPYPDSEWNRWFGSEPRNRLVCAQSVYVDDANFLWILDSANPRFQGVISGGAKLLKVDLRNNKVMQTIRFGAPVIHENSYLNDIRIDTRSGHAFISDSGSPGLIVVNLATGLAWRVLDNDISTTAEDIELSINGMKWLLPDGETPRVHIDGIAIDPSGEYLYFKALTGRTLYRIKLLWLLDENIAARELPKKVENLGQTVASDGLEFDRSARLYFTAIEDSAIKRRLPDGTLETVTKDNRLQWPDSMALAPDGSFYVTTSRIHLGEGPYKIFRFTP